MGHAGMPENLRLSESLQPGTKVGAGSLRGRKRRRTDPNAGSSAQPWSDSVT